MKTSKYYAGNKRVLQIQEIKGMLINVKES